MFENDSACLMQVSMSPFVLERILNIRVTKQVNEHSKLWLRGVVREQDRDAIIETVLEDKAIVVKLKENKAQNELESGLEEVSPEGEPIAQEYCVFSGLVSKAIIHAQADVRIVEIEALSYTWKMDRKQKIHTYQKRDMPVTNLFEGITERYAPGGVRDYATQGDVIREVFAQYYETDWRFNRRIASKYFAPLIPVDSMEMLRYYVGVPDEGIAPFEINTKKYELKKSVKEYADKKENGIPSYTENNAVEIIVEHICVLELAQPVLLNGMLLYVKEIESTMNDARYVSKYTLCDRGGLMVKPYYNDLLRGTSLFGNVTDVQTDEIKLSLDCDKDNPLANERWFAYSTVYSQESGSGWYSMPEKTDRVRLFFPTRDEFDVYSASSVDLESADPEERRNPEVKVIHNVHGKKLTFAPSYCKMESSKSQFIVLDNDEGITIESPKGIFFNAKSDINMVSETGNITATAENMLTVKSNKGSNVDIMENIDIKGEKTIIQ